MCLIPLEEYYLKQVKKYLMVHDNVKASRNYCHTMQYLN